MTKPDLQRMSAASAEPERRKPKFGIATMLLVACGALFVAGLFIFFVVYGIAAM
jgi:hypothetical protein